MNEEILAELRKLRHVAEDQERQQHWQAISGHFTRFVILFCAARLSIGEAAVELRVFAGCAGVLWLIMTAWHTFVLMPSRGHDPPLPPPKPLAPPSR